MVKALFGPRAVVAVLLATGFCMSPFIRLFLIALAQGTVMMLTATAGTYLFIAAIKGSWNFKKWWD